MKTYANLLFDDFYPGDLAKFTDNPNENNRVLEALIESSSRTKCTLQDIDIEHPNTSHHLMYLLQTKKGIPFGICDKYRTWKSYASGWQRGCAFDKGKGERIQVNCYGSQDRCERLDSLNLFLSEQNE
ncbi:hypothetical protein JXA48_03810 [Candidatus Woesearchaeota archaeon]|nr:hypothetical protein [Candidatus Woesearchaeota archaeon]